MNRALLPPGWPRPKGYANGIAAEGRLVFTAGVVGWDENEHFASGDFAKQFEQAIKNTISILNEGGAKPEHIVRMTWYVTDKKKYINDLASIGAIWRDHLGRVYPCMAVVEVTALMEDEALLEIETTAVVPHAAGDGALEE